MLMKVPPLPVRWDACCGGRSEGTVVPWANALPQALTLLVLSPRNRALLTNVTLTLSNDFTEKTVAINGNINFPDFLVFPVLLLLPPSLLRWFRRLGPGPSPYSHPPKELILWILLFLKSSLSLSH